jgi:3-deoxy-7-phosphoheptulonate synthase
MILDLKADVTPEQKAELVLRLRELNCEVRELPATDAQRLALLGETVCDEAEIGRLTGVARVRRVKTPFKLAGRDMHPADTWVRAGDTVIGGRGVVVIAGPCAVEGREQALATARAVRTQGASLFRGGVFKPRTSPYSFQGLGEKGLEILSEVRRSFGLGVVTEMTSSSQADAMEAVVDMVQIGSRNMQNFELLKRAARLGKPVLLKRGFSATIEEWLLSAEYLLSEGNGQVVLCERGIRTFEPYTRNTLDLSAIPLLKQMTHLPVVVDPSHATGVRALVPPMARSAIAAGADGLMLEVHHDPERAMSDGAQSLYPEQLRQIAQDIQAIAPVVGRHFDWSGAVLNPLPSAETA